MIHSPKALIERLCALPSETEWLEFKENRFVADEVGRYISSLSNSAILHGKDKAYIVYGVHNAEHRVVGTTVRIKDERVGGEPFESWIARMVQPRVHIELSSCEIDGKNVEIISIDPAYQSPVRFQGNAYIRIDSIQKPLSEYPERERQIWAITSRFTFERGTTASHLSSDEILDRFDCETILKGLSNGNRSPQAMIEQLQLEELISDDMQGGFDVSNLFALLAARNLSEFPLLARKAPRVVYYKGSNKLSAIDDITGSRGYGITFSNLLGYILERIPHKEEIRHGIRSIKYAVPEISIREFLANSLIHQDLTSLGDGPLVEIFSDRIRITNPGMPLIDTARFIDAPSKSRNEHLASLMRRLGLCEQRGSGIDRALDAIESDALPPPLFQATENSTIVTVYYARTFAAMDREDRVRACYQHACLKFEAGQQMSNSSLRARFGLSDKQYPQVSVVIREAIEAEAIRPLDEDQAKRNARYVPFWA